MGYQADAIVFHKIITNLFFKKKMDTVLNQRCAFGGVYVPRIYSQAN